eukprot:745805-Hanusia_phi.AAC.3
MSAVEKSARSAREEALKPEKCLRSSELDIALPSFDLRRKRVSASQVQGRAYEHENVGQESETARWNLGHCHDDSVGVARAGEVLKRSRNKGVTGQGRGTLAGVDGQKANCRKG